MSTDIAVGQLNGLWKADPNWGISGWGQGCNPSISISRGADVFTIPHKHVRTTIVTLPSKRKRIINI